MSAVIRSSLFTNDASLARSPVTEDQGQIERPNHAVAVEVGRMPAVRAPEAQHQRQVKRPDLPITTEVPRAGSVGLELIGPHVHFGFFIVIAVHDARIAVEIKRRRLVGVAVVVEISDVRRDGLVVADIDAQRIGLKSVVIVP